MVAVAMAALLAAPSAWAVQTVGHATSSTFPAGGPGGLRGVGPGGRFGGAGSTGSRPAIARLFQNPGQGGFAPGGGGFPVGGGFAGGAGFGGDTASLGAAVRYVEQHGGGEIGVASQSTAAAAILDGYTNVAGLGGFSGRESSVTASWIAMEVREGRLRWVIVDNSQGASLPGDTRSGSEVAIDGVAKTCRRVTLSSGGTTVTMYDCLGRAAAILQVAKE